MQQPKVNLQLLQEELQQPKVNLQLLQEELQQPKVNLQQLKDLSKHFRRTLIHQGMIVKE